MADSYYNLMGPERVEYTGEDPETADGSGFTPTRPATRAGVPYEQVNAGNINANIRRSMDR